MSEAYSRRFDLVAEGYDSPALHAMVTSARRLVELADLSTARLVVDVGTGTGHAAIAAAQVIPEGARVVGIEPSGGMREQAQAKVRSLNLSNVEIRDGDALALPFDDNSVDALISASAIYTLPDIPAALREWRRVLAPGARVAFSSLGVGVNSPYFDLLERYGIPVRAHNPLERVSSVEKCLRLLEDAGFEGAASHVEQLGYFVSSADDCWALIWNTGARIPLTYLPPPVVDQLKTTYLAAMERERTSNGIWIDWPAVFSLGRKPADFIRRAGSGSE